ncbi:MAG TPA: hypothetical protein VNU97_06205 [Rhizomicrobium sp.]|jgi:hypothetical protein|nr:hypothetical protein [Rhizomicrobium sp.]
MPVDAAMLKSLIAQALPRVSDARILANIRELLVEPAPILRDWDYGEKGEQFVCWTVLEHPASNTGIAYCESGFGPRCPWGLVFLTGDYISIGQDSGWFENFLDAYFESYASTDLAIWRVFETGADGVRRPITTEGEWDATWEQVSALRKQNPQLRYDCGTNLDDRDR